MGQPKPETPSTGNTSGFVLSIISLVASTLLAGLGYTLNNRVSDLSGQFAYDKAFAEAMHDERGDLASNNDSSRLAYLRLYALAQDPDGAETRHVLILMALESNNKELMEVAGDLGKYDEFTKAELQSPAYKALQDRYVALLNKSTHQAAVAAPVDTLASGQDANVVSSLTPINSDGTIYLGSVPNGSAVATSESTVTPAVSESEHLPFTVTTTSDVHLRAGAPAKVGAPLPVITGVIPSGSVIQVTRLTTVPWPRGGTAVWAEVQLLNKGS